MVRAIIERVQDLTEPRVEAMYDVPGRHASGSPPDLDTAAFGGLLDQQEL